MHHPKVTVAGLSFHPRPTLVPLGDRAILVRFGTALTAEANTAAVKFAALMDRQPIAGTLEIVPNLVSVALHYDPAQTSFATVAGEVRLKLSGLSPHVDLPSQAWTISVVFDGPDLAQVATALGMTPAAFIAAHNVAPLRVLATGFAPGFVYCGLHAAELVLPRRTAVRPLVPAGSVLFAAGQTAITATAMPTGWHVIGHTDFRNFDPRHDPPTQLLAGDSLSFRSVP